MLSENIARDYNRAPIIIWSVGNDTPISTIRYDFMEQLIDETHWIDNSRLVSASLMASRDNKQIIVDDQLGSKVDLLAVNAYNGRYVSLGFKRFPFLRRQHPIYQQGWNRKVLISETDDK